MRDIKDKEWIKPKMRGFIQECCDCGLKHKIDFKFFPDDKKNPIEIRFTRLEGEAINAEEER